MDSQPLRREIGLRWIVLTLPGPIAAAAIFGVSEWLYFATKPSSLTALLWPERLLALAQLPAAFVPILLGIQVLATGLSLLAFPRFRAIAIIPPATILGVLLLTLIDNFTHVLFGFSSITAETFRIVYASLLLILVAYACHAMLGFADRGVRSGMASPRAWVVWLMALPALVTFAASAAGAGRTAKADMTSLNRERHPNVLLLSSDGVEARRLSAYGYEKKDTTPLLTSLRDESLFCENAFANTCRTYGSMVSLLTGKLPVRSRVIDPPSMLQGDARYEHLPRILRQRGYKTIQLTIWFYADAESANFLEAFDLANYKWEGAELPNRDRAADASRVFRVQVLDRLVNRVEHVFTGADSNVYTSVMNKRRPVYWRDERKVSTFLEFLATTNEPWFAHIHLLDSHLPQVSRDFDYDTAVRAADDSMARIVASLRRSGQLERTILVISSDHGREWQSRERVPLLFRFPGARHARRERRNAQLVDVAPTILDYLRFPVPPWMDGQSLLRPETLDEDRPVFAVCGFGADVDAPAKARSVGSLPGYAVDTATVVVGSSWYELNLARGAVRRGSVAEHTAPRPAASEDIARGLAMEILARHGYAIAGSSAAAPAATELVAR